MSNYVQPLGMPLPQPSRHPIPLLQLQNPLPVSPQSASPVGSAVPFSSVNFSNTNLEVHKVQHTWTINHFSFFEAKKDDLHSPVFASSSYPECKWYLRCRPMAPNSANDDLISIGLYLRSIEECNRVLAKFRISILDSLGNKSLSKDSGKVTVFELGTHRSSLDFNNFECKEYLLCHGLIPNDTLTICCELSFTLDKSEALAVSGNLNSTPVETKPSESRVCEDLKVLLKNELFTDVVLCAGGKEYRAHKPILAARSPVFAAMFHHNMAENKDNRVEITDIEGDVVEDMLNYIYGGKCEKLDELAAGLLVAADKYELKALKVMCGDNLLQNLSIENAIDVLVVADLHHADKFKSKTIDFIVSNSPEVMKTESWKSVAPSKPHLMVEICQAMSRRLVDNSISMEGTVKSSESKKKKQVKINFPGFLFTPEQIDSLR